MSLPFRQIESVSLLTVAASSGSLAFESDTGILRSIKNASSGVDLCAEKRSNQLGQLGGIRIWDDLEKRWWDDLQDKGVARVIEQSEGRLSFEKSFDGCPFRVTHNLAAQPDGRIRWDLSISQDSDVNRGLRVCYQIPIVAGWSYFAPCLDGHITDDGEIGDCDFDGSTMFNFMYHQGPYYNASEITLPLFSMYDRRRDSGLQLTAPADAFIPGLAFEYSNRGGYAWGSQRKDDPARYPHVDVMHNFVGIHGRTPCVVPMEVYFGQGCYRPLLGQYVEAYRDMFFPKCEKIWDRVGTFQCGGIHLAENDESRAFYKAVGGKYLELHGHFPYYGKYWNEGKWGSIGEYERRRMEIEKTGGKIDQNVMDNPTEHSQERLLKGIQKLQDDGISVHIYFNLTDGDRTYYFPDHMDSLNVDEDGNPWPSGWKYCNNIHAHPGSSAWDDFIEQARNMREYYPVDGYFFDCFRHYDFDFGWSDGITMINNKPCSCVNFSMSKITTEIMKETHKRGQDAFANKPRTTTSMADVDGMLLEGDGKRSEMYYYYTTLAKPNFYMWGGGVRDIEECLKRTVVLAAWPNTPRREFNGEKAEHVYAQYLPLYPYFTRKVFCFEKNPMRLDVGLEAELYTVGNDYVAGIMRPNCGYADEPHKRPRKVGFVVEKADYVSKVIVHYAGEKQPREMPVYRADEQIVVPLALLRSAAVVKLVVGDKKSEIQKPFEAVTDYFESCGDPLSAFEMGKGANE